MSEPSENSSAAVPVFKVSFDNNLWWAIPAHTSKQIYEQYVNNQDAGYTWDWGSSRAGSWQPDGEETTINRYIMGAAKPRQRSSTISTPCVGRPRKGCSHMDWGDPRSMIDSAARPVRLPTWLRKPMSKQLAEFPSQKKRMRTCMHAVR